MPLASSPRCARRIALAFALSLAWGFPGLSRLGAETPRFPDLPADGAWLADHAGVFTDAEARSAAGEAVARLRSSGVRAWVVSVSSLEGQGAPPRSGWTPAAYARALLEEWSRVAFPSGATENPAVNPDGKPAVPPGGEAAPRNPGPGAASTTPSGPRAERALLVLVSVAEKRACVATGLDWLRASEDAQNVARVLAYHLEREDPARALREGARALETLVAGDTVTIPGGEHRIFVFMGLFLVLALSFVDYMRKGTQGIAYRLAARIFSAIGASLTYVLTRSVDLGARWSSSATAEQERDVSGRW